MKSENWGVGNAKDAKAFDTIKMNNQTLELIHGEHPHSRRDNNMYARGKDGRITEFDGHRRPIKIEIEEHNYLKSSELSGDEIRKGGSVKVFCDGIQIYDEFCRSYESGFRMAHNFILEMEQNWDWFPKNCESKIGKVIGYHEQLFKIRSFIVSQACMMIETIDGKPRKRFLWEDDDDFEQETELKVGITDPQVLWYPNLKTKSNG